MILSHCRQTIHVSRFMFWLLNWNCPPCWLLLLRVLNLTDIICFLCACAEDFPLTQSVAWHSTQVSCCSVTIACDNKRSKPWQQTLTTFVKTLITWKKKIKWKGCYKNNIWMPWLSDFVCKTRENKIWLEMTGKVSKKSFVAVVVVAFYFLKASSIIHQKGEWNSLACDL